MPRSIVVGTDGSEPAEEAVRQATDMASREGARLHLVTAYHDPQIVRERMTGGAHAETVDLRTVADAVLKRAAADALAKGVEKKLKPLVVTVLDARGCVKISAAQDGTSLMRSEIAHGKAYGALAMGMGSRALFQRAQEQAYFVSAVNTMAQGRLIPVPGGVLIQDGNVLFGAVGVSGDTSDNDEICAVAGIEAAGLKANAG